MLTMDFCFTQTTNYCADWSFESIDVQADSINLFMEKAIQASRDDKTNWEKKFFCAFPNSFASMEALFGYDKEAGPLYFSEFVENPVFHGNLSSHIDFFSHLTSIPHVEYYNKYIDICINGNYQADNIRAAFGFGLHLLNNPKQTCEILSKRSDNEIKSVFRFIFDGPHPDHETNMEFYKKLLPVVKAESDRLSKLLVEGYQKLMNENHDH